MVQRDTSGSRWLRKAAASAQAHQVMPGGCQPELFRLLPPESGPTLQASRKQECIPTCPGPCPWNISFDRTDKLPGSD